MGGRGSAPHCRRRALRAGWGSRQGSGGSAARGGAAARRQEPPRGGGAATRRQERSSAGGTHGRGAGSGGIRAPRRLAGPGGPADRGVRMPASVSVGPTRRTRSRSGRPLRGASSTGAVDVLACPQGVRRWIPLGEHPYDLFMAGGRVTRGDIGSVGPVAAALGEGPVGARRPADRDGAPDGGLAGRVDGAPAALGFGGVAGGGGAGVAVVGGCGVAQRPGAGRRRRRAGAAQGRRLRGPGARHRPGPVLPGTGRASGRGTLGGLRGRPRAAGVAGAGGPVRRAVEGAGARDAGDDAGPDGRGDRGAARRGRGAGHRDALARGPGRGGPSGGSAAGPARGACCGWGGGAGRCRAGRRLGGAPDGGGGPVAAGHRAPGAGRDGLPDRARSAARERRAPTRRCGPGPPPSWAASAPTRRPTGAASAR